MTDRTTEEAKREEGDLIAWAKLLALDLDTASGCTERDQLIINEARSGLRLLKQALEAALQWQAEQQKGEAASNAREVLAAGIVSHYGVPDDKAYECASKVLDLAASPHGVPPQPSSIQQRAIDLHEKAAMPWPDAEELALNEAGIDARAIDELIGECGYAGLASMLCTDDELRRFTRSVLVHQPAASLPQAPQGEQGC